MPADVPGTGKNKLHFGRQVMSNSFKKYFLTLPIFGAVRSCPASSDSSLYSNSSPSTKCIKQCPLICEENWWQSDYNFQYIIVIMLIKVL